MTSDLDYRPKPSDIPTEPGVYRFIDGAGRVLYVGKAKNLRARLANYFAPLASLHERTRRMVTTARSVEWTVVRTEIDALQLEFIWINEFDPPFNVQFRDDKSYPYLVVTMAEEAPRVFATRRRGINGAKYFGPYPQAWAVYESLDLLRTLFPMRTCKDADYRRAMQTGRPCFASQIGRCHGPCSMRVTIEEHREVASRFVAFMNRPDRQLLQRLESQMKKASDSEDFETAAKIRDQLIAARAFFEKSSVVLPEDVDVDVFGIVDDELSAAICQFTVRNGMIRAVRSRTVDKELELPRGALVASVIEHSFSREDPPAFEVCVPELPDDHKVFEMWLSEMTGRQVSIRIPQRGEKATLLQTAQRNAEMTLALYRSKRSADFTARSRALEELQAALGLSEAPLRIEGFDVSHLQGSNIVASMVVFEDGLPRKDHYRRFNIADAADDTDAIFQVIQRRLARLEQSESHADDPDRPNSDEAHDRRFSYRPSLLVIDGGSPQVQAASRALSESGVQSMAIVGIAKRLEELWLPGESYPVVLPRASEALFLVQRIRDEAHRFAINHQRNRRKNDINTVLATVPGLGPARIRVLLRHFGSVTRLKSASVDEIRSVPGIGTQVASAIFRLLAGNEGNGRG